MKEQEKEVKRLFEGTEAEDYLKDIYKQITNIGKEMKEPEAKDVDGKFSLLSQVLNQFFFNFETYFINVISNFDYIFNSCVPKNNNF